MQSKQGINTGLFGEWLTDYLKNDAKYSSYQVYYDHGDRQAHPNVVEIKGFYGNKLSRSNMLTQADILVLDPQGEVSAIFEIEESSSSPKKIIGDVFANLMCSGYSINLFGETHYYNITAQTKLVVASIVETQGSKLRQLDEVVGPRLMDFESPKDSIDEKNITLLYRGNFEDLTIALKNFTKKLYA